MIDQDRLHAYRSLVADLQDGLIDRSKQDDSVDGKLRALWKETKEKDRTADSYTAWREQHTEQVAVAWVLTTIFVRYLEDNGLIADIRIAGEGDAEAEVEDHWRYYFSENPTDSEADYLLSIFRKLAGLPAGELFGPERNALYQMSISGDAGRELFEFFRKTDPDTGELVHRFETEGGDTRFLGDLYQDLSEAARKRYALLQTPDFVEEFILDLTLEPAIDTFGLDDFRFIDPTCGSGHFLLGGFRRLLKHLAERYPAMDRAKRVRRALEATHGVDINPFATSIARFRLLVAALFAMNESSDAAPSLADAPELPLKIATGDSLILGRQFTRWNKESEILGAQGTLDRFKLEASGGTTEDYDLIFGDGGQGGILTQQYHAVVGNPPYITVKDNALGSTYRNYYDSCYYQYSLVCPFYERFFDLAGGARLGDDMFDTGWTDSDAGFVGMIVGNSFMKRTFGQKLIEEIIPCTDLTHVIDTSGAYIPGHGTPTIILAGRNRAPKTEYVRAGLGIRGEPSVPKDPANAKVWSSIRDHIQEPGFENDFLTVDNVARALFHDHPWSLRGGGVLEAKVRVEEVGAEQLEEVIADLGRTTNLGVDEIWRFDPSSLSRHRIAEWGVELCTGENVRDWSVVGVEKAIYPYNRLGGQPIELAESLRLQGVLWPFRTTLRSRKIFGRAITESTAWYGHLEHYEHRLETPFSIPLAFVATHNHFTLERGGKLFKQSAPVIKLPTEATEADHLALLGPLNSSTGCFWMKQVFFNKGYGADSKGARSRKAKFEDFYEHDGTKMQQFPLPERRPADLPRRLDALGQRMVELQPHALCEQTVPTPGNLAAALEERREVFGGMLALQEEIDWQYYGIYGLCRMPPLAQDFHRSGDRETTLDELPHVEFGERPFEIVLARKMESGDIKTTWFERHGSTPRTDIPDRWPDWYRDLVQARIDMIDGPKEKRERFVRLIEAPEFKRRWNLDSWEKLEEEALETWLKDRLETRRYIPQAPDAVTLTQASDDDLHADGGTGMGTGKGVEARPELMTVTELAHKAREDEDFMQVAERYTGDPGFDVERLVADLVAEESVPFLPSLRYKKSGLERRREWEDVWDLQRQEDAIDARTELPEEHLDYLSEAEAEDLKATEVGDIPKPPKYRKSDYTSGHIYNLRGTLDVPKERFTSYPGLEGEDGSQVISWAGLDHLHRAKALATFYYTARNQRGWDADRLVPILAGLKDLLPWVEQWHPEPDPRTNQPFVDFLRGMIETQARELGVSLDAIEEARIGG